MTDALQPTEYLTYDAEEPANQAILIALQRWFYFKLGRKLARLTKRIGGGGGHKSSVYFAYCDGGEFVVRLPHKGTGWNARALDLPDYHCLVGAFVLSRLRELGQPVPAIIAIENDHEILGGPFVVLERISGIHMADYDENWSSWPYDEKEWGEFLRACHGIEPPQGAGPLSDDGVGWYSTWSEFIERLLCARATEHAQLLPPDFNPRWERILRHHKDELDSRPLRLLQMESNGYCNLILDPATRRLQVVLDFEEATSGDPLFELATMGWYLGRRGLADHGHKTCFNWQNFYKGYGTIDWKSPLLPIYKAIILLEKLWREDRQARIMNLLRITKMKEAEI